MATLLKPLGTSPLLTAQSRNGLLNLGEGEDYELSGLPK